MKKISKIITVLVFIFLYIPILVLAVGSFNTGSDLAVFEGFTLNNYAELFKDRDLLRLLLNSLIIAVLSSLISTVLGTAAAVGIHSMKGRMRRVFISVTQIPMVNPEIVTGVALALLFAFVGSFLKVNSILGFWTLLIAHITFNLPYVILNVMPRFSLMDPYLEEAAMDLGCSPAGAFFKVTLPEILPGVISGAIMAFTMSLDDFVISYFVSGSSFVTLPVEIYNYTKKPIPNKVYALFTLMFMVILLLMVLMNLLQARDQSRQKKGKLKRKAAL